MNHNDPIHINIKAVSWQDQQTVLKQIRIAVFIEEQGVPVEMEWDNQDDSAQHWLAYADQRPVGCARLMSSGQLGRIAVLSAWRKRGIGRCLVQTLLKQINQPDLFMHAQLDTVGFYQPLGFTPVGEVFEEAGIKHIQMVRQVVGL